jgi:hypothetical protein
LSYLPRAGRRTTRLRLEISKDGPVAVSDMAVAPGSVV